MATVFYRPNHTYDGTTEVITALSGVDIYNGSAVSTTRLHDTCTVDMTSQPSSTLEYFNVNIGDGVTSYTGGGLGIINHSLNAGCTWRLFLSDVSYGGFEVFNSTTYRSFNLHGSSYQSESMFYDFGTNYSYKYAQLRVYTYDPAGTKATSDAANFNAIWTLGTCFVGRRTELDLSLDLGIGVESSGGVEVSRSGDVYPRSGVQNRVYTAKFYGKSDAQFQGTGGLMDIIEQSGMNRRIIMLPRASSDYEQTRLGIYGRITNSPGVRVLSRGNAGLITECGMTISEEV